MSKTRTRSFGMSRDLFASWWIMLVALTVLAGCAPPPEQEPEEAEGETARQEFEAMQEEGDRFLIEMPPTPAIVEAARGDEPRIAAGKAVAEQLGPVLADAAGPFSAAQAGDWKLANEYIAIFIADVEEEPTTISLPVAGYRMPVEEPLRMPGALIDVLAGEAEIDFVGHITQAAGGPDNPEVVRYDSIELVQREDSVGIQLEGSPFDNALLRLRTTYWLREGERRVRVENELSGLEPGEIMPEIYDVAWWGGSMLMTPQTGYNLTDEAFQEVTDYFLVHGGQMSMGIKGVDSPLAGTFHATERWSRVGLTPTVESAPKFADPNVVEEEIAPVELLTRELWLGQGHYEAVLPAMMKAEDRPMGRMYGIVTKGQTAEPDTKAKVVISRVDKEERVPIEYVVAETDSQGRYSIDLPEGMYIVKPESETKGIRTLISTEIEAGKQRERNLKSFPSTGMRIKVVDANTSQPLAAHLQIEAIPPTAPFDFGLPSKASAYFNTAYIPPEGGPVYVPEGYWLIRATHGPRYDMTEVDKKLAAGKVEELTIRLAPSNPTPGWHGVEFGVRTWNTPGCLLSPEDVVLMAAAEGIDFIVSGDFETITDLGPVIERMGLESQIRAIRGFRTMAPKHPEWGQFLVFGFGEDVPSPAEVSSQWHSIEEDESFIAKLRSLYPGAFIQSDLPYASTGMGYLARGETNIYVAGFNNDPEIEYGIDGIDLRITGNSWDARNAQAFYFNNLIRGRFYFPTATTPGRLASGSEPGYPRLLVHTGQSDLNAVEIEELLESIRQLKCQLTTGPFIRFEVGNNPPGALIPLDHDMEVEARVTAPNWQEISRAGYDKDGKMANTQLVSTDPSRAQRFPHPDTGQTVKTEPLRSYRMMDIKDTLFTFSTGGDRSLNQTHPGYGIGGEIYPFAMTMPIVVDANGNGEYDPLDDYAMKGR